ncbi:serine hydrolase domain-containing protein [Furfurilactobacillus cerevisiae]|uniref:serine hydrolase domain-containing protein n=1 Tax=Furfurilactobacillus rossiae TaxID=231049 RepID=UPI003B9878DC
MFKQKRIWFVVLIVLLVSTLAWGTLYHEVQRSTKVAHPVYKRKPAVKPIATWQSAKIPTAIDHTQADSLDKKMQSIDFVGSVLVVRGGKVVFERQYGNANAARKRQNGADTAYAIASIQKIATGALVMQQVQQNHLSLSDHISKFYKDVPHGNEITIRQMLDMTSGLTLPGPPGPTTPQTDKQIVDYDLHHLKFNPQLYNQWRYSQVNYNILAGVLTKLTGKSYEALFNQQVIRRFNLRQTVFMPSDNPHVAVSYAGTKTDNVDYGKEVVTPDAMWHDELGTGRIAMSARDLYVMISQIMQGKLISQTSVNQLYESGSRSTYGGGTYNMYGAAVNHGLGYGYQGMSIVSKNGQNGLIMLSNSFRAKHSVKPFAEQLYLNLFKK